MDAAGDLVRRYSKLMFAIARKVLKDTGEAEDLVQEVFLFIVERSELFDPSRGTVRSWIMQVTYHRAYDRRRYLRARSFYDTVELPEGVSSGPRSAGTIEDFLAWRSYLCPAFEQLPLTQQRALVLHFFEGYTIREISQELNESEGNVQHHLYRGLAKLRSHVFNREVRNRVP
jgi:RNA polymerase sigma-70 factor (ECF subfamily)